jgi:hypothetical protein
MRSGIYGHRKHENKKHNVNVQIVSGHKSRINWKLNPQLDVSSCSDSFDQQVKGRSQLSTTYLK